MYLLDSSIPQFPYVYRGTVPLPWVYLSIRWNKMRGDMLNTAPGPSRTQERVFKSIEAG
jgi:hypothetical protein